MPIIYPLLNHKGEREVVFDLSVTIGRKDISMLTVKHVSDEVFNILQSGDLQQVQEILETYI